MIMEVGGGCPADCGADRNECWWINLLYGVRTGIRRGTGITGILFLGGLDGGMVNEIKNGGPRDTCKWWQCPPVMMDFHRFFHCVGSTSYHAIQLRDFFFDRQLPPSNHHFHFLRFVFTEQCFLAIKKMGSITQKKKKTRKKKNIYKISSRKTLQ